MEGRRMEDQKVRRSIKNVGIYGVFEFFDEMFEVFGVE